MLIDFNTALSTEMIHPQIKDPVIDQMLKIIADFRSTLAENGYVYNSNLNKYKEEMGKIISKRFGFNIKILFTEERNEVMYTYPIVLKPVSSLQSLRYDLLEDLQTVYDSMSKAEIDYRVNKTANADMVTDDNYYNLTYKFVNEYSAFLDVKKMSEIEIDRKKAYVYNFPKDLTGYIVFSLDILDDRAGLTDREFLAMLWHEVGHNFTSIENTYKNIANTNVLVETVRDEVIKRNNTPINAVNIMYKKLTGETPKFDTMLDLAERLMTQQLAGFSISTSDLSVSDSEWAADNFTVRFGLGADNVSALKKMNAYFPTRSIGFDILADIFIYTAGWSLFIMGLTFMLTPFGIMVSIASLLGLFTAVVDLGDSHYQTRHDHNIERIRRMKIDLIRQIKNHDLNIENKKYILDLMDIIDKEMKEVPEPTESIGSMLSRVFSNANKLMFNQKRAERLYETLIDNELHASTARIKTL